MKACLRSRDGSCIHQLRQPLTTIGCEGSDVIIQCSNVERQHAVIEYDETEGCFVVQDLNSAHGTYVNECRVQNAAVRLASGDIIRFGYENTGFEFLVDSSGPVHYPTLAVSKPWESYRLRVLPSPVASIQSGVVTSLPYISTSTTSSSEGMQLFSSSQAVSLPPGTGSSITELRGTSDTKANVMPHPPLRSRPTSAGATKARPSSAGRERTAAPPVTRGGWVNGVMQTAGENSVQELEERLLRMGDELSRLASYEAECHRKDGVIAALRDEVVDLKGALQSSGGLRAGGEDSAFSNSSIILQLREQVSQLQGILQEKEEGEKTAAQKLAMYQNQLHAKNNEVASLKDQLQMQTKATGWVKTDPNATTNKIASLRTEIAEKERRIAQLTNDNEKLNKQKMQSTTLLNGLQRENSAKDALVHQAKNEIEKLKKELREKDSTISTMSAKLARQKAAKDVEKEAQKLQQELHANKAKLQSTEKQLKERIKTIADLEHELEKMRDHLSNGQQSDKAIQQELDHAKAQCLDAQRAEKLLKVDFHQLEKRFDRFRRKLIEYTFSGGIPRTVDHELDDDELLDHVRQLTQEKLSLVEEIKQYASSESEENSLIFKMAYEKSVINININFESDEQFIPQLPKPFLVRKDRGKGKLGTIQPSHEAQRTAIEIHKRVMEVQRFRRDSQSALEAPLLVTALIKKTHQRLDTIQEKSQSHLTPLEKFIWAARVVHVLVSSCMRWRRYKKPDGSTKSRQDSADSGTRKGSQKNSGIGFDTRAFKGKSKISDELRQILTSIPRVRTNEGLKKIQRLCRSTRAFMIFPLERESDLSRLVGYERYDNGRVLACQGRIPERFYYVLSGRVSKVCVYDLAAGVTKMSFGELMQGNTTDPVELMNGTEREHSLICKGPVEVLVLDKEDFMELMNTSPDSGLPIETLRSIELFRNFPLEKFLDDKDAIMTKYFAKEAVIVKDSSDTPFFYIVKSGRCKVVRKQEVLDMSKTTKLPSITTVTRKSPRSTPGKNPTSLLELTETFSKKNKSRLDKITMRTSVCSMNPNIKITGDSGIMFAEKNDGEHPTSRQLEKDPIFNSCGMTCPKKPDKITKKVSDVSVTIPTRTALLQIAVLKPGNMFGLESMMPKVATKISSETDAVEENQDPSTKSLILISEGAECIMINKRFFLMNASITTLVQLKALREDYMTVPDARHRIQCLESWDLYKGELIRTLTTRAEKQARR